MKFFFEPGNNGVFFGRADKTVPALSCSIELKVDVELIVAQKFPWQYRLPA